MFCVSPHSVLLCVDPGEVGYVCLALRVMMIVCCLLCVSRRRLDGLVGNDGLAYLVFAKQPVDRCASAVFCVSPHSLSLFVDWGGFVCFPVAPCFDDGLLSVVCVAQAS